MRRAHLLCLALFTLLFGCAKSSRDEGQASKAAAAPMAAATAAAAAENAEKPGGGGAKGGKDGKEDKKKEVKTWQRAKIGANKARLAIGDRDSLPLAGMQATVVVDGFRARVVLDEYFKNDRGGSYEGTFQLRLPNEASPYFFAFGPMILEDRAPIPYLAQNPKRDVLPASLMTERAPTWTAPKEARMVPKEKAAAVYGATVRQNTDPALVEWAGAGVFNARVFPLSPNKVHRIVMGYDVNLVRAGDDMELSFDVPEDAPSAVIDLSLAPPEGAMAAVTIQDAAGASKDVATIDRDGRKVARIEGNAGATVAVRYKKAVDVAIHGEDARTGPYFAMDLRPDWGQLAAEKRFAVKGPPDAGKGPKPDAKAQGRAVLLIDTSLSSAPDKFNIWVALAEALLKNGGARIGEFNALFFNVEARWYKSGFVPNTPENVAALMDHMKGLALEGATNLGAALQEASKPSSWKPPEGSYDMFLLSDAAATWGESDLFTMAKAISGAGKLFAYQTGLAGTETEALNLLTRERGGAVFSVAGEAEIEAASTAYQKKVLDLVKVEVTGGSDVLVAGRPKVLYPGQSLLIAGRGALGANTEVAMTVRDGKKESVIKMKPAPLASPLAPRVYGQMAVGQLEELGDTTTRLATAYATYFRVTGKTTSLLMLETEDEYKRAGVVPEDPNIITRALAAPAIDGTLKEIGDALGDPKLGFLSWLDKLGKTPNMNVAFPSALREALGGLNREAFTVNAPPLAAKITAKKDIPGAFSELLALRRVEYDPFTTEAERRLKEAGPADALKALSSLIEESPGDSVLARDVAFSAMAYGQHAEAYHLLRRVAASRPFEPQTYRAMASCLVAMKKIDLAIALYEIGVSGKWDDRFGDFPRIVGVEYLHLLRQIAEGKAESQLKAYAVGRLEALSKGLDPKEADLVIVIMWNTDNTDVDLHVIEPSGEECFYGHRQTKSGGELTRDVTRGYGPEMYVMKKAPKGTYKVRAHYFASDRNRTGARTKVQALIVEGWGRPTERVTEKVVTLEYNKDKHDIAVVER